MESTLSQVRESYLDKIAQAETLKELDDVFLALFGKNGEITLLPKDFSALSPEEKQKIGPLFNQVKTELEKAIEIRRNEVHEESYKKLAMEKFTFPPEGWEAKKRQGHLHPVTQFEQETIELFKSIGFQQLDAPHIDTDYNNFQVLNIPEDHPARDLQDTFYLDTKDLGLQPRKLLLRTHTSNVQIRALSQIKPPIRIMNIGRCFRYENLDPRHEHTFEQFELIYVDEKVSMANLQYLSEYLLKTFFGKDIKVRLRPKYYPFVEPGAGVDALCIFCKGKGCRICGGVGWLELAGAGMIHPKVLQNGGIDPQKYSGIAWGFSPLRILMLKYGIEDIRVFNSGDLRFLNKF